MSLHHLRMMISKIKKNISFFLLLLAALAAAAAKEIKVGRSFYIGRKIIILFGSLWTPAAARIQCQMKFFWAGRPEWLIAAVQ